MRQPRRSVARAGVATALFAALMATALTIQAPRLAAQTEPPPPAPTLEVLSVQHDPAGTLSVGIRAAGSREVNVQSLTMFIDGIPITLDLSERQVTEDLAVLLAIDTSGSMNGAPIVAAQESARLLIQQLSSEDRVGVLSFGSTISVPAALDANREQALAVIPTLTPAGSTALYQAVADAAAQLEGAPEERRAVVLLSDGQDEGDVSTVGREESIQRAADSGVTVYAVGLGPGYDEEYLRALAGATEGEFFGIRDQADAGALTSLFTRLGGELGSNETYTVPMQALERGTHELNVRGVIDGVPVSTRTNFEVTNEGLLAPSVEPGEPGDAIEVDLGPLVAGTVAVEAHVGDRTFRPASPTASSIAIDPWRLTPGTHEVELVALTGSNAVAARQTVSIEVPELAPELTLVEREGEWVARGRVQQDTAPTLVARAGDAEVARSTSGELVVAAGTDPIFVELTDASGEAVATEEIPALATAERGGGVSPLLLLLLLLVLAGGAWWWLKRRRGRTSVEAPVRRRAMGGTGAPPTAEMREALDAAARETRVGLLAIVDPSGNRTHLDLTRRPVTIGSAAGCDVVIDDPAVRPRHARLTVISSTEVQVHALGERGARPYDGAEEDAWLVMHGGDQLALGSHYLLVTLGPDAARSIEGEVETDDRSPGTSLGSSQSAVGHGAE